MVTTNRVNWRGFSGRPYDYEVLYPNFSWPDQPGNYIFAKRSVNGWIAVYVGQTSSLKDRLSNLASHHKYPCALRNGMTAIHAHLSSADDRTREAEEADLINSYHPVCNG